MSSNVAAAIKEEPIQLSLVHGDVESRTVDEKVNSLLTNVEVVKRVMKNVMKAGEHYHKISGSEKYALSKSGAEKLTFIFRIATKFEIIKEDLPNGHREYTVTTSLYSIETGKFLGCGVGSCTTMEKKYRYRSKKTLTNEPVPKEYWDTRDKKLLKGFDKAKNDQGKWVLAISEISTENPDIADVYNTCLKMAKKRSLVDGTLTATAASDIFTQDIDEDVETDDSASDRSTSTKVAPKSESPKKETDGQVPNPQSKMSAPDSKGVQSLEDRLSNTKRWLDRLLTNGEESKETRVQKIQNFKKLWIEMKPEFEKAGKGKLFQDGVDEFNASLKALDPNQN